MIVFPKMRQRYADFQTKFYQNFLGLAHNTLQKNEMLGDYVLYYSYWVSLCLSINHQFLFFTSKLFE